MNKKFISLVAALVAIGGILVVSSLEISSFDREKGLVVMDGLVADDDISALVKRVGSNIVIGEVESIGPMYLWQDRLPSRNVVISIEKVLKGTIQESNISIRVIGGRFDSVMTVHEAPGFNVGERVLLFLGIDSSGGLVVYGGRHGKYLLENGKAIRLDGYVTTESKLIQEIVSNLPLRNLETSI